MSAIILVRHAQSEHQVGNLVGGWADFGLTELGRRQADCLASRLKTELGNAPCHIYCSDLKRAVQTAEIVGRAVGFAPDPVAALRDIGSGIVTGLPQQEAREHFLPPTEPIGDWIAYPDAESWRQVYARVAAFLESLAGNQQAVYVLVTHQIPAINVIHWWLRLDATVAARVSFVLSPASITVLHEEEWGARTIERLNDTAHLYAEGLAEGVQLRI